MESSLMLTLLLLVTALASVHCKIYLVDTVTKGSADYEDDYFRTPVKQKRILSGEDVDAGLKWKVSLKVNFPGGDGDSLCAGTIVDTINIITAASCLQLTSGKKASKNDVKVYAESDSAWRGRMLKVATIVFHPKYKAGQVPFDLAILKLSPGQVDLNMTACLPTRSIDSYVDSDVQIGGYGATRLHLKGIARHEEDSPFRAQSVKVPSDCMAIMRALKAPSKADDAKTQSSMNAFGMPGVFCAGDRVTCYGDGGGPVYSTEEHCPTQILLGVIRNASNKKKPCDTQSKGMRVSSLHTSIFYHLYGETWLCKQLGWRQCK